MEKGIRVKDQLVLPLMWLVHALNDELLPSYKGLINKHNAYTFS